ncbi:unnamed protein product, partial [Ixodes pacificus]
ANWLLLCTRTTPLFLFYTTPLLSLLFLWPPLKRTLQILHQQDPSFAPTRSSTARTVLSAVCRTTRLTTSAARTRTEHAAKTDCSAAKLGFAASLRLRVAYHWNERRPHRDRDDQRRRATLYFVHLNMYLSAQENK